MVPRILHLGPKINWNPPPAVPVFDVQPSGNTDFETTDERTEQLSRNQKAFHRRDAEYAEVVLGSARFQLPACPRRLIYV